MDKPTVRKYGSNGILMEWEALISPEVNAEVVRMAEFLQETYSDVILEVVPSYNSLMVYLKNGENIQRHIDIFRFVDISKYQYSNTSRNRMFYIPTCYDSSLGYDLETISGTTQIPVESIIQLHSEASYRIYAMGFLPGFLYLGGLSEQLHFPRKRTIRQNVPKGSVAIGGEQTGIYPQQSPGGWNIIGRTPIELFDTTKKNPTPFSVGDSIQFTPVSLEEFNEIQSAVNEGKYELKFTSDD
jgi:KipI family sensor histidine kinase inhibitor